MQKNEIEQIVSIATQKAFELFEREKNNKESIKKKELSQNTKKLLREFNRLKAHVDNAITSTAGSAPSDIQIVLSELFDHNGYIKVRAIIESKERSELIVHHIERMLDIYKRECENSNSLKYKVLLLYYVEHKAITDVASAVNMDERTVWRYARAAIEDMSILLFGVMAIEIYN